MTTTCPNVTIDLQLPPMVMNRRRPTVFVYIIYYDELHARCLREIDAYTQPRVFLHVYVCARWYVLRHALWLRANESVVGLPEKIKMFIQYSDARVNSTVSTVRILLRSRKVTCVKPNPSDHRFSTFILRFVRSILNPYDNSLSIIYVDVTSFESSFNYYNTIVYTVLDILEPRSALFFEL